MMRKLVSIHKSWGSADGQERSRLCLRMKIVIKNVRPEESIVSQIDSDNLAQLVSGIGKAEISEMMDLQKVLRIMKDKTDGVVREGYSESDYDKWTCDVNAVSDLIILGLPADGDTFSDRKSRSGAAVRNKNSKISSFLQNLSVKNPALKAKLVARLEEAFHSSQAANPERKREMAKYRNGMIFDGSKVEEDKEENTGVSTGMANVDRILLAAFHMKKIGLSYEKALGLLKGVAAYSMRFALTKERVASLRKVWAPIDDISKRFVDVGTKHMCTLELTSCRLVNCASLLFKGASDIYVLRMDLDLAAIAKYIAGQLNALGGVSRISTSADDTSSVEWLLHRLLLAGYIEASFNPIKTFSSDYADSEEYED